MRFLKCLYAGTALAALLAADATAQTTGAVEEIIVTARQREESLKDVPIAVSVVTAAALERNQIYAVKDIAAYTPGLNINSDSVGRAFVSIRGVGTTLIDTVQPGVGIFIDGIYQPNTSYLNSPLVDVARVEVLRGPQGTLFGNNTLGGAINVITRAPGNQVEGKVTGVYAGSDDFRSASASISGPIVKDVLQVRIGGAYHHQDGFQENTLAGGDSNPLTQKSGNLTARLHASDAAMFTLNASYDKVHGGNTPYLNVAGPRDYTLDGRRNANNLATLTYKGANLKGEFDIRSLATTVTAIAAWDRRDGVSAGDGDYGPVDFLRSSGANRLISRTGELRFDTKYSERFSSLVGVFANRFNTYTRGVTTLVPLGVSVPSSGTSENESQAIFGTLFVKLDDTLDLAAGLRFDHQRLNASSATTAGVYTANELQPRVTLSKRWTPDTMTYLSVAKGVRGGGQNGPGAPNLIYQGDSVWTYEAGAKLNLVDRTLSLDTAIFYNDYKNFIGQNALAPSTSGAGFVAVNLNSGDVTSYGVEAELNWRVTSQWRLNGGLTLLHARIKDGTQFLRTTGFALSTDRIIFTPDWNFNVGSSYTVPVGSDALVFDAGLVAKGSRIGSTLDPAVAPKLQPYYLVNASIAYQRGGLEVALFATNLFNEKYIETYLDRSLLVRAGLPAPVPQNLAIQGDRRRVGIRAGYKF